MPISAPATTSRIKCIPRKTLESERDIPRRYIAAARGMDVGIVSVAITNAENTCLTLIYTI